MGDTLTPTSTSGSGEQYNGNGNSGYTRPPIIDGENFEYWKDKLESYFLGLDGDLWDLLVDGYKHPVKANGVVKYLFRIPFLDSSENTSSESDSDVDSDPSSSVATSAKLACSPSESDSDSDSESSHVSIRPFFL